MSNKQQSAYEILEWLHAGMYGPVTTKQLREVLLASGGTQIVGGRIVKIRRESLGAGVYNVYLEGSVHDDWLKLQEKP